MEQWRIVVKDRYPAYIDWQTYEKIRGIVSDNRAEYMRNKTRGAPRDGELLLLGIAWCGKCGHKMYVRYKGGAEYVCNHLRSHQGLPASQHFRAPRVDAAVAQAFSQRGPLLRSMHCLGLVAFNSRRTKRCGAVPSSSLNAGATKQRWPNGSSIASIPTTGSSPPASSCALSKSGERRHRVRCSASPLTPARKRMRWTVIGITLSAQFGEAFARQHGGVLKIPVNWLYVQIRLGRLQIDRHPSGAHLFSNTPSVIKAVRKLRNHEIDHLDLRIIEPHKEGHSHG
jgi:Recombinase zinc beta ribbon domain